MPRFSEVLENRRTRKNKSLVTLRPSDRNCNFNATMTCSAMDEKCHMQCPKLKMEKRIYSNVSFLNTSKISHKFLSTKIVYLVIHYWHQATLATSLRITIWTLKIAKRCKSRCTILSFGFLNYTNILLHTRTLMTLSSRVRDVLGGASLLWPGSHWPAYTEIYSPTYLAQSFPSLR